MFTNALSLHNPALLAVAGGLGYARTAFVGLAGNDGTAMLNNPALPFFTTQAALTSLATCYPTEAVTLRLLSYMEDIGDVIVPGSVETYGLSITGHNAVRFLNSQLVYNNGTENTPLELEDVRVGTVIFANNASAVSNAATVTASGSVTIDNFQANGEQPSSEVEAAGGSGRSLVLVGAGTLTNLSLQGANGVNGGTGGDGGDVTQAGWTITAMALNGGTGGAAGSVL